MALRVQHFKYWLKNFVLISKEVGEVFSKVFNKFCIKYVLTFERIRRVHKTPTFHLKSIRTLVGSTEIMSQLSHWEHRCRIRPSELKSQQIYLLAR